MPLATFTLLLQPHFEDTGDLVHDWYPPQRVLHAVPLRLVAGHERAVWAELARLRASRSISAVALFAFYAACVFLLPEEVPSRCRPAIWILRNLYIWWMLCAILGYAPHVPRSSVPWLPWANEAVYPWYVLHQSLIVAIAFVLVPMHLGPVVEPALVLARHRRRLRAAARDHSPHAGAASVVRGEAASGERGFDVLRERLGRVGRCVALEHLAVAADQELGEVPLDRVDAEEAALLFLQPLVQGMGLRCR